MTSTNDFYKEVKALAEEIQELRDKAAQLEILEKDLALVWSEMDYYYDWADRLANAPIKSFPMAAGEFRYLHRVRTVSGDEGLKLQRMIRIRNLLESKGLIPPLEETE